MIPTLSDSQIRVRIAEACGWRFEPSCGPLGLPWRKPNMPAWDGNNWSGRAAEVPDYLHSLDAMHEAEKTLGPVPYRKFADELWELARKEGRTDRTLECYLSATARSRALAFLQTIQTT